MKKIILVFLLLFITHIAVYAQNVGIGTNTPSQTLHVYTTTNGSGAMVDGPTTPNTGVGYLLGFAGTQKAAVGLAAGTGSFAPDAIVNDLVIRTVPATSAAYGHILFNTNGGASGLYSTMMIDSNYVGIGMRGGHPGALLQVGTFTTPASTATSINKSVFMSQDGGYGQIQIANPVTSGNPESTIAFINEVTAIGSTPTSTLNDSCIWAIGVNSYQPGGNSNKFVIGNKATGNNGTGLGSIVVIQPNGRVGINTTTPGNTLELTGAANSSGLRFTNLKSSTNSSLQPFGGGIKALAVNSSGDVVASAVSSSISAESHYMVCVRCFPLLSTLCSGCPYDLTHVWTGTDDYGLPFVSSSTVNGTPFPYPYSSGTEPPSYYINPYYNNIDDNGYLQHGTSNIALIYDFYIVFPSTTSYTFSFTGVDDAAYLYTTPANDLNPADMVQRMSAAYNANSGNSATNYTVSATAGDAMRARVYWAQGTGGLGLTMSVSGGTTNLMSLLYSIK